MGVAFVVAEERHPQIVIGKLRNEVRFPAKRNAAFEQEPVRRIDVVDLEIDHRGGMGELLLERPLDEEADTARIEKRETRRSLEEESQAEHVTVESHGAVEV